MAWDVNKIDLYKYGCMTTRVENLGTSESLESDTPHSRLLAHQCSEMSATTSVSWVRKDRWQGVAFSQQTAAVE